MAVRDPRTGRFVRADDSTEQPIPRPWDNEPHDVSPPDGPPAAAIVAGVIILAVLIALAAWRVSLLP